MVDTMDRALSLLSIAAKAGKVVSGGFMCENAVKDGTASLVIIAEDASGNTRKKFTDKTAFYGIPCVVAGKSEILGHRIGKQNRMVVAITDEGLAKQIANKLDS